MDAVRLRFPGRSRPDLPLEVGTHPLGRGADGLDLVDEADALIRLCVDRRGAWLSVAEGAHGVHVNGRPIHRIAMLRTGDAIYLDGIELRLVSASPPRQATHRVREATASADPRIVLRGVGGRYHGRSFTLERSRLVGRCREADIRIEEPAFADRHAYLDVVDGQAYLRDLGDGEGSMVNGEFVRDVLLQPGDQLLFGVHHRFVLEAPRPGRLSGLARSPVDVVEDDVEQVQAAGIAGTRSKLPWLLLAALLIAASLSALLLFGSA